MVVRSLTRPAGTFGDQGIAKRDVQFGCDGLTRTLGNEKHDVVGARKQLPHGPEIVGRRREKAVASPGRGQKRIKRWQVPFGADADGDRSRGAFADDSSSAFT